MQGQNSAFNKQYEKRCRAASFFESEAEIREVRIELHRTFNLYKLGGETAEGFLEMLEGTIIRVKAGLGYYHDYGSIASDESVKVNNSVVGDAETFLAFQAKAYDALNNLEKLRDGVLEVPGSLSPEEIGLTLFDELEDQLCSALLRYQVVRTSVRKSEQGKKGAAAKRTETQILHNQVLGIARELIAAGHHKRNIAGIIERRGVGLKARQIRNILNDADF